MKIISVFSTKGGPGKSTKSVNLAAFCADCHKKTLLIDGDYAQPSATSYYDLVYEAPYGIYELLTKSAEFTRENFICKTIISGLDLIKSNDPKGRLVIELLHASDGRLRLNTALKHAMFADYDVIIIDTQGARSVVSEVVILASDIIFCITKPVLPEVREFLRCTIPIFEELLTFKAFGIESPPIKLLINCMDYTVGAKETVLSPYLTPSCQDYLQKESLRRKYAGELTHRVRGVYEIPGRGYKENSVKIIDRDNWIAILDLVVDEYYNNEPVKRALVRYPIRVVRWESDPERNPFSLALDCYAALPQRLEAAPVENKENRGFFQ